MNPDVLKVMAVTAGALIASPFMMAGFRAFFFFGKLERAVESGEAAIARVEATVNSFISSTDTAIADHESRITVIEAERRTEARLGRRATDRTVGEVRADSGP